MSTRRRLGPGPSDVAVPARGPRARTAAEHAAGSDWVELPDELVPGRAPTGGRRALGSGVPRRGQPP